MLFRSTKGLIRIFSSFHHIPSLKRNMISLGILNSKGCLFVAHHGLMKVKRGQWVMLMGREVENLYVLIGKADVVGEFAKPTKMV